MSQQGRGEFFDAQIEVGSPRILRGRGEYYDAPQATESPRVSQQGRGEFFDVPQVIESPRVSQGRGDFMMLLSHQEEKVNVLMFHEGLSHPECPKEGVYHKEHSITRNG